MLAGASATALFAELLLIRWESSEIPVLAYFKNFPLLAIFIGLGVGCLLARRVPLRWTPGLWAFAILVTVIASAHRLRLDELVFPEPRLDIWNRGFDPAGRNVLATTALNLSIIFALLALNVGSFLGLGQAVGGWLTVLPPLTAYTADVAGSLAGVLAFAACSWLQTPPAAWLLLAVAGLALTATALGRLPRSILPLALVAAVALFRAGRSADPAAVVQWSPYYRIEVTPSFEAPPPDRATLVYRLEVNRDYHQVMADLADRREWLYHLLPSAWTYWQLWRAQYAFAYLFKRSPRSVLIGGAGSGNNAAAALRFGAGRITAVEIDPGITAIGRRLHPMHPYDAPNVRIVNTDVRSFVRRTADSFDLIEYGILDSHTALSALSSLRLENYVYTVEGLREAVRRLTPDGVMVVSFHDGGRPWLGQRLFRNITLATGTAPVGTRMESMAFFVFGPGAPPARARAILRDHGYEVADLTFTSAGIEPSTDDWPFLYTNPAGQPLVYGLALALIVLMGSALAWRAARQAAGGAPMRPDFQMFFLGAGFLLIETKALVELSLLFGSTWIVNTLVFAGIFVMVLLANGAVALGATRFVRVAGVLLAVSLLGWYLLPHARLNDLAMSVRLVVGTGLAVLPVLFAGIIFSSCFARRASPDIAFGFNLIGAMAGGALEAVSLVTGLRALSLLALLLYALAWLTSLALPNEGRT